MSTASSVDELKQAILKQAQGIADEYRERAHQARDNILKEARERLHLREEHETRIGRTLADKEYSRKIQANELKLHRKLDMLRWSLVETVMNAVKDHFTGLMDHEYENYIRILGKWANDACVLTGSKQLVAEVNNRDYRYLKENWDVFTSQYIPDDVDLKLSESECETLGGIRLRTPDNRIRLDNCYEGRMQRLEQELQQCIMHRLFSNVEQLQQIIHK
jgi:V/A-type H+-transporting ATPase subunit E